MKFKLREGITSAITVRYMETHGSSQVYTHKTFEPGKIYGFEDNDELAKTTLLKATTRVKKRQELADLFNENGIEFKLIKPSCHCQKVPFMEFCPIVEVEE